MKKYVGSLTQAELANTRQEPSQSDADSSVSPLMFGTVQQHRACTIVFPGREIVGARSLGGERIENAGGTDRGALLKRRHAESNMYLTDDFVP